MDLLIGILSGVLLGAPVWYKFGKAIGHLESEARRG